MDGVSQRLKWFGHRLFKFRLIFRFRTLRCIDENKWTALGEIKRVVKTMDYPAPRPPKFGDRGETTLAFSRVMIVRHRATAEPRRQST
jgi:hypothetical protein